MLGNEGKCVADERFIRTLKNKIFKYMTSISKNVYIDNLDDKVNKYNNTYYTTIKMKPVEIKPTTYIDSSKKNYDEDAKFKIDDIVRISKYRNVFAKSYVPNWSENVFVIKILFRGQMLLVILNAKKLLELLTKSSWK